ncbi:hypothetical protein [Streptosporangium sp. NPDC020145]|uniref:hypothetical protein n=1 Tax=Streptosporangium sp. NPDC020145 TaxID=3154694 RepID=UPI0034437AD4
MRRSTWTVWTRSALVLVPAVLGAALVIAPIWRDTVRLEAFRERVLDLPLPPRTRSVYSTDRDVVFGPNLVGGSGSSCDYRVRLTLRTALTPQEIQRFYRNVSVAGAETKAEISLFFEDEEVAGGHRFVLEAYDSHDWDGDWRCA